MMNRNGNGGERILLVAPTGADSHNLCSILNQAGFKPVPFAHVAGLAGELDRDCGAILLTEEALTYPHYRDLSRALNGQPAWSDLPVILIVSGGSCPTAAGEVVRLIGPRSNITLVERPLRRSTLLSTLQAALRARQRQYEVRNLLCEREELLASLEKRVADRTARLEALNAELEAFSYSVSHDLRAPLRALEGYARILCEEYANALPDEARRCAERIAKNAEKMDRLTSDVLALSRLTRSDLRMHPVNLDELLPEVIDQYPDLTAAAKQIEIHPPLGCVWAHGPSLTQCFSNLLQNALKFVPAGRVPHITIQSEISPERVRISIQDNGVGIDPAHHDRIFGIFERVSSAAVPGTGIGLAIAKKAVERMSGTIGVESALGAGACFWIELPAASAAARAEGAAGVPAEQRFEVSSPT